MKINIDIKSCKDCPNIEIESTPIFEDNLVLCDTIKQTCKLNNKSVKEFYRQSIIPNFCPLKPENKKKKDKIKIDLITGVWKNFCTKESWLKTKTKPKDLKCVNCSIDFATIETNPALVFVTGELNKTVCDKCANKFINEYSKRDLEKERLIMKSEKELMIQQIRDLENYNENYYYNREKLEDKKIEDLHKIYDAYKAIKDKQDRIDAIAISEEDSFVEDYLIKDYDLVYDNNYLKCEEQIEDYFKNDYSDYFDCGQGYSQDEAIVIIKIAKKFYEVNIKAEIGSAKQDRGDRLYWVEKIESVTWKEIDKPLPKPKVEFTYSFNITEYEKTLLDNFLWEHKIKFEKI